MTTAVGVLELTVDADPPRSISVTVGEVFNFGYAGRDQGDVAHHVDQMRAMGMPAPRTVPAIFPVPPTCLSTQATLSVSGDQTYGEVEFALIKTREWGWLVTIASDHTDLEVEVVNMPKAKGMCPDVLSPTVWRLSDVIDDWDDCVLRMWGHPPDGAPVLLQEGKVAQLLSPADIIATLQTRRASGEIVDGTVIMSGTIAGEPTPGMLAWSAELTNPRTGRKLGLSYELEVLPEEL